MQVWLREADQRAGAYHFEVLVAADGMKAQYRCTTMATDTLQVREFRGETSEMDAMRIFSDRLIEEVHGG